MKNILTFIFVLLTQIIYSQSSIVSENFGNPSSSIACYSYQKWQGINKFTYKTGDLSPEIRNDHQSNGYINASGGGNLSFEGDELQYLDISGINTIGFANLSINFYAANIGRDISNDEISIIISDDYGKFIELELNSNTIGSNYGKKTVISDIPNSKNLSIRILYTPSDKDVKIRIDDFKLLGCLIPVIPTVSYAPTACMFEVLNLPSNTFIQTSSSGTDVNPVNVILSSGNYYIRTVSTTMGCSSVWSQSAKFYVTVHKKPTITRNPIPSLAVFNKESTYSFIASADTSFYWEVSKDNGSTWGEIKSEGPYFINGDTLRIKFTNDVKWFNGYQYRITTNGSGCKVSSTAGTLFVPEPSNNCMESLFVEKYFTIMGVSWTTNKEKDISHYQIERADSKMNWSYIGMIVAMHNTDSRHNYLFYDNFPITGTAFYRIKIIKEDGGYNYTPVIVVNNDEISDNNSEKIYYTLLGEITTNLERNNYYIEVVNGVAKRVVSTK